MRKYILTFTIICLLSSCEKKMTNELEATLKEIIERQDTLYEKLENHPGSGNKLYFIQELKRLKSDIAKYTKKANEQGYPKNNDGVISEINSQIKELEGSGFSTFSIPSNDNEQSLQGSVDAYRKGYNDGQMVYGLPASETATAEESYMAHRYQFSAPDITVYRLAYLDGLYGRKPEY